jgi:hypothetical protein
LARARLAALMEDARRLTLELAPEPEPLLAMIDEWQDVFERLAC